jgi:hypothetical protein
MLQQKHLELSKASIPGMGDDGSKGEQLVVK